MSTADRERQALRDRQFGDWVRATRKAMTPDAWTQGRLVEELARIGRRTERPWISQIENGSHAGDDLAEDIQRVLGHRFQERQEPAFGGDVAAAIREQTAALRELVEELRTLRRDQLTIFDVGLRLGHELTEERLDRLGAPQLRGLPKAEDAPAPLPRGHR